LIQREIVARRLAGSHRARVGALLLSVLVMIAIFADFLAGDAPLASFGRSPQVFAGVVHPSRYEAIDDATIAATFGPGTAVWPLVRFGPERETSAILARPSKAHPFGTDERGRDVFARVVYGVRTALGMSLAAVLGSLLLGLGLGGAAGFVSRTWDRRLERLIQIVDSFPVVIVVALVRAIEGKPSSLSLIIAVAIVRWAEVARLVRAEVLRASTEEYVLAARAFGASRSSIFLRHILRNALGPVMVSSVFGLASIALLESVVSFLQLGARAGVASWGETLAQAARHPSELRLLLAPGAMLLVTVGASYLVADSLRDAIDARIPPRER
jgi:peptide/nickel transport system permease protein